MGWSQNGEGDRGLRTATAPSLQTGWTMSIGVRFTGTTLGRGGIGCVNGVGGASPYFFLAFDPDPTPHILIDYDFGAGFLTVNGGTLLEVDTDYHLFVCYDGTNIRVYLDGVLEITSADGVYGESGAEVAAGWNVFDGTLLGNIYNPKFWSIDIGAAAATILGARQYRNPQVSPAQCWETWHAKTGALGTGALNARDLTMTSAAFVADAAFILGDDPAPAPPASSGAAPALHRRRAYYAWMRY